MKKKVKWFLITLSLIAILTVLIYLMIRKKAYNNIKQKNDYFPVVENRILYDDGKNIYYILDDKGKLRGYSENIEELQRFIDDPDDYIITDDVERSEGIWIDNKIY